MTEADAEQGGSAETRLTTDAEEAGAEPGLQLSRVGDVIVISADSLDLPSVLSESERAVARALIAGSSNAEIARARGTSVKTVANQLYAMYRKLGVGTREELVARLVDGDEAIELAANSPVDSSGNSSGNSSVNSSVSRDDRLRS